MLRVRDLHVNYGAIRALQGVSLEVNEGEVVALIGANGAGKSTLLRTISGVLTTSAGDVAFEGRSMRGLAEDHIVRLGLLQVQEGRGILTRMTVQENLEMGAYCRSDRAGIRQDMEMVFDKFPVLRQRRKQFGATLSGGEQQMLAIGRALMARPKLLMLDEPSLGLAPMLVNEIFRIIREFKHEGPDHFAGRAERQESPTVCRSGLRAGNRHDGADWFRRGPAQKRRGPGCLPGRILLRHGVSAWRCSTPIPNRF